MTFPNTYDTKTHTKSRKLFEKNQRSIIENRLPPNYHRIAALLLRGPFKIKPPFTAIITN